MSDALNSELVDKLMETKITKYKLSRPVTIADKTYTELTLDFDKLTTEDMIEISNYPGVTSQNSPINEQNKTYVLHIVARAAGLTIHELKKFPIADGTALTLLAQGFLMSTASEVLVQ